MIFLWNRNYRKDGEGLFTREFSDRTRRKSSKLKEGRFGLDIRKKFFTRRPMRHWPQRSCGCSLPERVQDQGRWVSEESALVENVPAYSRGSGTLRSKGSLRSLSTQNILCIYN